MRNRPNKKAVLSLRLFQRYYMKKVNTINYDGNRNEFSCCSQLLYGESITLTQNNEDGN